MADFNANNPFGAPILFFERVSSTMDEARRIAGSGYPHGTVVAAGIQDSGRGRVRGRIWDAAEGSSLLCTTILRFASIKDIPAALTLRVGLAAAEAIEDVAGPGFDRIMVKWPNDILCRGRKLCGILCESDGSAVFVGSGFNIAQTEFPAPLAAKASSILLETGNAPRREALLEAFLERLKAAVADDGGWKDRLERRLFKRGERVVFETGAADSGTLVAGILEGIGSGGELRIVPDGETSAKTYVSGELRVYG